MDLPEKFLNPQDNKTKLIFLTALFGVATFIAVTYTAPFEKKELVKRYPKPPSQAIELTNDLKDLTYQLIQQVQREKNQGSDGGQRSIQSITEPSLQTLASRRKELMLNKAKSDTRTFIRFTLPKSQRDQMPESIKNLVEEDKEVRGKIQVRHEDYFGGERSQNFYTLTENGTNKTYNLHPLPDDPISLPSGTEVTVKGPTLESDIVNLQVDIPNPSATRRLSSVSEGIQRREFRVAVIMANYDRQTPQERQPYTRADIENTVFGSGRSVKTYYEESSKNTLTITGRVLENWYTISLNDRTDISESDKTNCWGHYQGDLVNPAVRAAMGDQSANFRPAEYSAVVVVITPGKFCEGRRDLPPFPYGWAGHFSLSDSQRIPLAFVSGNVFSYFTHEIGHNMTMNHASSISFPRLAGGQYNPSLNIFSSPLSIDEYGDDSDIMGRYTLNLLNAPHRKELGLLQEGKIRTLPVNSEGTYNIWRLGTSPSRDGEYEVLKIKRRPTYPDDQEYYYLSLRKKDNSALFDYSFSKGNDTGFNLHLWEERYQYQTKFIIIPYSSVGGSLGPDQVYRDFNGLEIRAVNVQSNSDQASVYVKVGSPLPCTRNEPSANLIPLSEFTTDPHPNDALRYDVEVQNNDEGGCADSIFNLEVRSTPLGWTHSFGNQSVILPPGTKKTVRVLLYAGTSPYPGNEFSLGISDNITPAHSKVVTLTINQRNLSFVCNSCTVDLAPPGAKDGKTDMLDYSRFRYCLQYHPNPGYVGADRECEDADIDKNGRIGVLEFSCFSNYFGVFENQATCPSRLDFEPKRGVAGAEVVLTGVGFGDNKGVVWFEGREVTVSHWSNTEIRITVPGNIRTTYNEILVLTADHKVVVASSRFEVITNRPIITTITPTSGPVGTEVRIEGRNFGNTQGTVLLNPPGIEAFVRSWTDWTDTTVLITIPSQGRNSITIYLQTANGRTAISPTTFDVTVSLAAQAPPQAFTCTPCAADIWGANSQKDKVVTMLDYSKLSSCFRKTSQSPEWQSKSCNVADIDGSGVVNQQDANCLTSQFGQKCQ